MEPFDIDGIRGGFYTDVYFTNIRLLLERLSAENYRFAGISPVRELQGLDTSDLKTGDVEVEMQFFHKRDEAVVCGISHCLDILKECAGYFKGKEFVKCYDTLEIYALKDGELSYNRKPVMKIRGVYRYFGYLETVLLGILARQTRVATNAYRFLKASNGRPVFFFGGRFDLPQTQALDGEAYCIGVNTYNRIFRAKVPPVVATPAQAHLWGGVASGTTAHALMMVFLRDTVEAMLQFARILPPDVLRVALVDSNNDCVGDSERVAEAFFETFWSLKKRGRDKEAELYRLYGVRADTAEDVMDVSLQPGGECGVVPALTRKMREALDSLAVRLGYTGEKKRDAVKYFRGVKVVASGGFNEEKLKRFSVEDGKVDFYGIGSAFLSRNLVDFTADVVRVKIGKRFYPVAKVGRAPWKNPALRRVK
ncbi:MAG: nicotinate phosphoribosyltransferase [Planctomycetota bacterium]|nr:nicotinate phosphoribosyltransferase [Planctomycetota bacterium]